MTAKCETENQELKKHSQEQTVAWPEGKRKWTRLKRWTTGEARKTGLGDARYYTGLRNSGLKERKGGGRKTERGGGAGR